jgi:hypothetical protein
MLQSKFFQCCTTYFFDVAVHNFRCYSIYYFFQYMFFDVAVHIFRYCSIYFFDAALYIFFQCCSTYFLMLLYIFFDVVVHVFRCCTTCFSMLQYLYSDVALQSFFILCSFETGAQWRNGMCWGTRTWAQWGADDRGGFRSILSIREGGRVPFYSTRGMLNQYNPYVLCATCNTLGVKYALDISNQVHKHNHSSLSIT